MTRARTIVLLTLLISFLVVVILHIFWHGEDRTYLITGAAISTQVRGQLILDVANCGRDYNWLYGDGGSVEIQTLERRGAECAFRMSIETEGGSAIYNCRVPVIINQIVISNNAKRDRNDYGYRSSFDYSFDVSRYCEP
jgi:hypothetical protein